MRLILFVVIVFLVGPIAHAQTPAKTGRVANDVTQYRGLAYPTRGYGPPKISLERALKIAETFIKKDRIDISSCFLIEAHWVVDEADSKNPMWQFYWSHFSEASRNVLIVVSADGKPYRLHLL